jgi:hypothetical protein
MSYQAYLDTIKAKTGKTPDDFRVIAAEKGLSQYSEVMAWLKADYGLGHGHANVIAQILTKPNTSKVTPDEKIDKLFTGKKEQWRQPYDNLWANLNEFGTDTGVAATNSYISLLRGSKKFGIVQPSSERLDIGIKLKDAAPTARFEAAGTWNNMVTHRVRISDPAQIDAAVLAWLKQAYDSAK